MVSLERKPDPSGGSFSYFLLKASHFVLKPAASPPELMLKDFQHFTSWTAWSDINYFTLQGGRSQDRGPLALPPALRRDLSGQEHFLSASAAITYWLAKTWKTSAAKGDHANQLHSARQALNGLVAEGQLLVSDRGSSSTFHHIGPAMGHIRSRGFDLPESLLSSAGFFVVNPLELKTPHQSIGDPVGLMAIDGTMTSPATCQRAALVASNRGLSLQHFSIDDHTFTIPALGLDAISTRSRSATLYWHTAHGHAKTPAGSERVDLTIVGNRVASLRFGGRSEIPTSGVVLSLPADRVFHAAKHRLEADPRVEIRLAQPMEFQTILQCGPTLISDGKPVDLNHEVRRGFYLGEDYLAVPCQLQKSLNIRAGRAGAGLDAEGQLVAIFIKGRSSSQVSDGSGQNEGATYQELTSLLQLEGAVDAMALDSGGSVQLSGGAGSIIASGDSRGHKWRKYDRPLPYLLEYL